MPKTTKTKAAKTEKVRLSVIETYTQLQEIMADLKDGNTTGSVAKARLQLLSGRASKDVVIAVPALDELAMLFDSNNSYTEYEGSYESSSC